MSRSHKARYDRYPHHRVWWLKNVRFASRRPSPRERTTAILAQLEEYLGDLAQVKLVEHVWLGYWRAIGVDANAWRDVPWDSHEDCFGYDYDHHYDDHLLDDERYDYDDERHIEEDVTCADPRWIDEYLLGVDTGFEERDDGYNPYDFVDRDLYDACEEYDEYDTRCGFWDTWPTRNVPSSTISDIARHRDRERLKAGNRHFRSHR